jgi:hypothetical protein
MDKLGAVEAAEASGFPTPATVPIESVEGARRDAAALPWPVVVKARFSIGSTGVRLATSPRELDAAVEELSSWPGGAILQEWVPGGSEPSLNFVLSAGGAPGLVYALRKLRYLHPSHSTYVATDVLPPETAAAERTLASLGLSGFVAVQTKLDSRTGRRCLIEINLRWGANSRIFLPMALENGLDPALLAIGASAGAELPRIEYPAGQRGASVLDDLVLSPLSYASARVRRRAEERNPVPPVGDLAGSYWRSYVRARPVTDVFWRTLRSDPVATAVHVRRCVEELGRGVELIPWGDVRS